MVDTLLTPLSFLDQETLEHSTFTIGYVVTSVDVAKFRGAAIRVVEKWRLLSGRLEWSKEISSWCIRVPLEGNVSDRLKFTTNSSSSTRLDTPFSIVNNSSQILSRPPITYFRNPSTPCSLSAYASSNSPIISIHITELSNVTCLGITVPHGVFDVFGLGLIIKALNAEMHGTSWDAPIPTDSNIMRDALRRLSVMPAMYTDENKEPASLSDFRRVAVPSSVFNMMKILGSITYDNLWHNIECKAVYLTKTAVESLVSMIKRNVKESDSEKWVSTGDVLVAWFLKSAYALEPNPRAVVWSWVSIRPSFVGEDPAFNNYHHNGIVLCSTPALTKDELSGSVASLALRHRQLIQPVRDIAYIQAYNSLTTSIKGGLLPRQTPGEEMWCLSNQVIGHLDDLDLGSEIHAIWDWHSPMIPSNTVIFNKVGGGYIIQANIRRSRWSAISDAIDRLTVD